MVRWLLPLAATAAFAASSTAPDTHDRALAHKLNKSIATLRALSKSSKSIDALMPKKCASLNGSDQQFAAAIALTPVLLGQAVHQYKAQLVSLRNTIVGMHPDSPLFAQWIGALQQDFALILQLDTHGRKIDFCKAAGVILDKSSTPAQWRRATGMDPALLARFFDNKSQAKLTALGPKMKSFFVAAGLSAQDAATLTS